MGAFAHSIEYASCGDFEVKLALPAPRESIAVRIFHGKQKSRSPAILYLHGGFFSDGELGDADAIASALTDTATVISVGYPLAPAAVFPVALESSYEVLKWAAHNARLLRFDPLRLYVGGDQAGGNIAAALAMVARDRLFASARTRQIRGQVLITPLLDSAQATPSLRESAAHRVRTAWSDYLTRPNDFHHPYASPLRSRRLYGLPPALLVTADGHPLQDEAELYASHLLAAGVKAQVHRNGRTSVAPSKPADSGFTATVSALKAFLSGQTYQSTSAISDATKATSSSK